MISLYKKYYLRIIEDFWGQKFSVISLGVFSALYFGSVGVAWAVTGEFTR
jgi:hypothetical protein